MTHTPLFVQEAATSSDHQLLAEYLDAIRLLTAAVHDDRKTKQDLVRLSDRVLEAQKVSGGVVGAAVGVEVGVAVQRRQAWLRSQRAGGRAASSSHVAESLLVCCRPVALQRLEAEMGRREPSVRELFRTASRLAQTFIVRQPPAGSVHGGGSGNRRSQDFLTATAAGAAAKGSKGGGSEAGSRPRSPEDMA